MLRACPWLLALILVPQKAQARSALDLTGHLKLFSISTFPVEPEGESLPSGALSASGSSVVDSRLKLLWRPKRKLRFELHPTITLSQGATATGLSTGLSRSGGELLPLTNDLIDDPGLQLRARLDRATVRWDVKRLRLTLGRQPVTFGKGRLFTPLDLVAPFSPTTLDSSFKPGVDAFRADLFQGMSGRFTLLGAYLNRPGEGYDNWQLKDATLVANAKGSVGDNWEFEGFAGLLFDEPVLGTSIFYNGGAVGVYGDLNITLSDDPFGRLVLGAQYKPTAKTFLTLEAYAQSLGAKEPVDYLEQASGLRYQRGELTQLGRLYAALIGSYELTPLLALSGAVLSNLMDPSVLLMPSLNWNVANNASASVGCLAGLGARPKASAATSNNPLLELRSEYGSVPFSAFVQAAFYF